MVSQAAKPWLKTNVFLGSYWSKPSDAPRAPRLPATVTKDVHLRNWAPHWALETFSPGPRYAPDSLLRLHLLPLLFTIVYQKMPLWCNWSKGLWCHIHTFLKAKNVFFSQRTTGILHIWLYHTIWGKVLLNRRTNVFAFFLWQRGLPKTRRSWLQHNELTVSSLCHFPFVPN